MPIKRLTTNALGKCIRVGTSFGIHNNPGYLAAVSFPLKIQEHVSHYRLASKSLLTEGTTYSKRLSSTTTEEGSIPLALYIDSSNRTVEEWQALTTYFLEQSVLSSPSASKDMLDDWMSTIFFWSKRLTVEDVNKSIALFDALAIHLNSYPEEDAEINEFLADNCRRGLNVLLKNWKIVLTKSTSSIESDEVWDRGVKDMKQRRDLPSVSKILQWVTLWSSLRIPVTTLTYNNLLIQAALSSARTTKQKQDAPSICEEILNSMLNQADMWDNNSFAAFDDDADDCPSGRPNTNTFSLVLRAWTKSYRSDAVQGTLKLLDKMNQLSEQGKVLCRPNTKMYNSILETFCNRKTVEDTSKAEQIFQDMDQGRIKGVWPDYVSYRIIFFALCDNIEREMTTGACKKAINFLHEMELAEKQHRILRTRTDDRCQPHLDSSMYAYLIMTLSRLQNMEDAEQVVLMLQKMQAEYRDKRFRPNFHTKRAMLFLNVAKQNAEEAENLLLEMERDFELNPRENEAPRLTHYEAVIEGLVQSDRNVAYKNAAAWIAHMLDLVMRKGRQDLLPRTTTINIVLDRLSTQKQEDHHYNIVAKEAPLETESLIRVIHEAERSLGLKHSLVNHDSYTRAIHSWAFRSHDVNAPQRAEKLLLEMQRRAENGDETFTPRSSHYTGAINAWAHSPQKRGLHHAKEIFAEGYEKYMSGIAAARPDSIMYGSIISACTRLGDLDGMEYFCNMMIHDYFQGNHTACPTTEILNSILSAYLRGGIFPPTSRRVLDIVQQFKQFVQIDESTIKLIKKIRDSGD